MALGTRRTWEEDEGGVSDAVVEIVEIRSHINRKASQVDAVNQINQVYSWSFDVFELDRSTHGRPLHAVAFALCHEEGLLEGWHLDPKVVHQFLSAVEAAYLRGNPYHNNVHAADVTQAAALIMRAIGGDMAAAAARRRGQQQQQEEAGLSRIERFSLLVAAVIHDLGHPGVNNDFLIKVQDAEAVRYSGRSVNENMHCRMGLEIAERCCLFRDFSADEKEQSLAIIRGAVMSTDMAVHFDLVKRFEALVKATPDPSLWSPQDRPTLLHLTLHLADLANPARPWPLASAWGERVVREFMLQGKREAERGLPVSPFCDRSRICMPVAQKGFINTFLKPTLLAFGSAFPSFLREAAPCLEETIARWECLEAAGVREPANGDYPLPTEECKAAIKARREAGLAAALDAARQRQQQEQRRDEDPRPPPQPQPQPQPQPPHLLLQQHVAPPVPVR